MILNFKFNKKWTTILVIVTFLIIIFNYVDIKMLTLPKGELIMSKDSHNMEYTLNGYLVSYKNKHETGIRVEVINNKTNKSKNIYWEFPQISIEILWIDDVHVDINDIVLDVERNTYKSINK